ncbi:MAG TPA: hypothetical protein PLV25_07380, partial [Opitutales bacterium]|nr:hypothetical protein [Opitutales bacterium]
ALYPYIPDSCADDFAAFEQRIESEFEALYPEVDLVLRPMQAAGDFYDYAYLEKLLAQYDLVELDSIFLGHLIQDRLIVPWGSFVCNNPDWQQVPQSICQQASYYAYPHWQCAYFAFGRAPALVGITNSTEFLDLLAAVPPTQIPLAINLNGKHTVANMYMDALTDANKNATLPWDDLLSSRKLAWDAVERMANYTCTPWGGQPALNGVYQKHNRLAHYAFARAFAAFYIGSSESFADIKPWLSGNASGIQAIHAPWGRYHNPTIMVDSWVLSRNISEQKRYYAECFAKYITAPETYAWMILGQDCPVQSQGRYLLPATRSAYTQSPIGQDPMMLQFAQAIDRGANPMPIDKYSSIIKRLGAALHQSLLNDTQCP